MVLAPGQNAIDNSTSCLRLWSDPLGVKNILALERAGRIYTQQVVQLFSFLLSRYPHASGSEGMSRCRAANDTNAKQIKETPITNAPLLDEVDSR